MSIIQPRAHHETGPIRTEKLHIKELLEWQVTILEPAIKENEDPEIKLTASIEACMWCPRQGYCGAATALNLEIAELEFADFSDESSMPPALEMTKDQIQVIIENRDRFIKWINAIYEHAENRAEHGHGWDGFKLVERFSRRAIIPGKEKKAIQLLKANKVGPKLYYKPQQFETPAEMVNILRARNPKMKVKEANMIVDKFSIRTKLGYKLVQDSTPGEAVASSAEEDFKKVAKSKPRKLKKGK